MQLTTWFTLFAVACGTLLLSRRLLHYFQLESYHLLSSLPCRYSKNKSEAENNLNIE